MTVRVYRSTDVGAPALTTAAGSLITVLDAILVNGYGSGGDAKAPLGWTKDFTASNRGVYRNAATSIARSYFYINDVNGPVAKIVGFESMTAIEAGTDMWPAYPQATTTSLNAYSSVLLPLVFKGAAWMAVGDETCLHFFCGASMSALHGHYIGDINTFIAGFQYASVIIAPTKRPHPAISAGGSQANNSQFTLISRQHVSGHPVLSAFNSNTTQTDSSPTYSYPYGAMKDGANGFNIMKPPSAQLAADNYATMGNVQLMRHPTHKLAGGVHMYLKNESTAFAGGATQTTTANGALSAMTQVTINAGSTSMHLPYPMEGGGLLMERFTVCTDGVAPYYEVGYLKGVWQPKNNISSMAQGDTFTGSGDLAGKTFEVMKLASGANVFLETSNTW